MKTKVIRYKHFLIRVHADGICTLTNTRAHQTWKYDAWQDLLRDIGATGRAARALTEQAGPVLFPTEAGKRGAALDRSERSESHPTCARSSAGVAVVQYLDGSRSGTGEGSQPLGIPTVGQTVGLALGTARDSL